MDYLNKIIDINGGCIMGTMLLGIISVFGYITLSI